MPDNRLPMLITLKVRDGEIKATGIIEDETVFRDAPFKGLEEALRYFTCYRSTHRVLVNIDPACRRML